MAKNLRVKVSPTLVSGGWQAYRGPGTALFGSMDGTSLSNSVFTWYDTANGAITSANGAAEPTLATLDGNDADYGLTIPSAFYKDGSVVTTLATTSANTHRGIPFLEGLFINKTGDTTHNAVLTVVVKPLIRKSVQVGHGATTDSVQVFDGPGIVHAVRITTAQHVVTLGTLDILFQDGTAGGSLRTLITATDYATAGPSTWSPVNTTGMDDAGAAVTTAATGAYTNEGVCFLDGLWLTTAEGSATGLNASVDVLIEA